MPHRYNRNIFNNNPTTPLLINNNNNNNISNATINSNKNIKNMGYIPSNKYAYMMNSPSPMKKR